MLNVFIWTQNSFETYVNVLLRYELTTIRYISIAKFSHNFQKNLELKDGLGMNYIKNKTVKQLICWPLQSENMENHLM